MGQTLENGVYLPSEGERNCYAGLKTNWEILDQKVADVTALQQAVAGALHREIVESLPTTDIDPNTIYMVLSGTSATENVYNEFMYVNNAWELIGTSATDLTNYYTKAEVDGKLLLKANDSDVVHKSGNETVGGEKTFTGSIMYFKSNVAEYGVTGGSIQFYSIDKNNVGLSKITQGVFNNGISYITLQLNGKDSNNQTVTNLIKYQYSGNFDYSYLLPTDNSVWLGSTGNRFGKIYGIQYYYGSNNVEFSQKFVTTDTDQTISGSKTFNGNTYIYNSDNTATTPTLFLKNSKTTKGSTSETGSQLLKFIDKNNSILCDVESIVTSTGSCELRLRSNTLDSNNQNVQTGVTLISSINGGKNFCPTSNNNVFLGASTLKWSRVYSTNYYYGNDNVEFSTKFVTTDTAQDVTANKNFKGLITTTPDSPLWTINTKTTNDITFLHSNAVHVEQRSPGNLTDLSGGAWSIANLGIGCFFFRYNNGADIRYKNFAQNTVNRIPVVSNANRFINDVTPDQDNTYNLGSSSLRWATINGLTPSSLSLPSGNLNDIIDISSYITALDGTDNTYIAPVNGWITINMNNCSGIHATIAGFWSDSRVRASAGAIKFLMPVLKNQTVTLTIHGGTINNARFIPCQGNV